jgi:hypothetical protein
MWAMWGRVGFPKYNVGGILAPQRAIHRAARDGALCGGHVPPGCRVAVVYGAFRTSAGARSPVGGFRFCPPGVVTPHYPGGKSFAQPWELRALGARRSGRRLTTQRGGLALPRRLCYPARVDPTPCGGRALGRPYPMLYASRLLSPARPSAPPQLWEWQQLASVNQQAVRGSYDLNVALTKPKSPCEPHTIRLIRHQAAARACRSSSL